MKRFILPLLSLLFIVSIGAGSLIYQFSIQAATVAVLTQHNDNQRTGANLNETILNTANVRPGSFGKLFTRTVDGQIYAQPLYVPGVSIPSQGVHNVVYVATQHNTVYAFDADDASASAPLWVVNLGQSAPVPADFGNRYGAFDDITVEVGITSSPVIDLGTNTMYVVTFIRDTPLSDPCPCSYHHSLHALDITSGAEKYGGPVQISGSVPGSGYDSSNGTVTFKSHEQLQRSALLLLNGVVYVTFASYGDTDPYHGWIFGYNATSLSLASIYNVTPDGQEGGVWQTGQGPSADNRYVYVITGNGTFNTTGGNKDFGDSFLKLDPQVLQNGIPSVADWFTAYNQQDLAANDLDLGSTGALLIPGTNYLVGGGKEGILYQVDQTNMGHYNGPNGPDLVAQMFPVVPVTHLYNSPIVWSRPAGPIVYIWGMSGPLEALGFTGNLLQQTPLATGSTSLPTDYSAFPGGAISLSANGSDPSTGIVWASHPAPSTEASTNKPGVLRAYDASNISIELWNSEIDPNDSVGIHTKYNAPTIANGKVYLGTSSNLLDVYGLLSGPPGNTSTPTLSPTPTASEIVDPADISALPAGTNVLLNFDNISSPSDGTPIPAGYAGCIWNTLVEGAPWAGITTWNFYITNGGPQGTILFPRPVIVNSIRVSSSASNQFTLSSSGNPDVSTTASGNSPQTLVTGWANPITSLTLRSSSSDQVFDDLRLTTAGSLASATPTATKTQTSTPTATFTSTRTATRTATPSITSTSTRTATYTPTLTRTSTGNPTFTPTASLTPTPTATRTATAPFTPTSTPTRTFTPTSTATQTPDQIFADGFESGGFSAWSASITNNGALSVSKAAALVQTYGMQVGINSNTSIYVMDNSPANEARYRARFYLNPNSIAMSNGNTFYLLYGLTSSGAVAVRIEFGRSSTSYRIRAGLSNNSANFTNSAWSNISNATHYIEFDWQAATSTGSANGSLTLWIDGVQRDSITGISNDTLRIDSVRLGAVAGINSSTRGTTFIDAFQSNRLTYIGP